MEERGCLAKVERGKVTATGADGYEVESLDRDGLVTPPILPLRSGDSFSVGDMVYFFLFDDGDGRILGK